MTTARVTQTVVEVVRQEDDPSARVTQTVVEVVRREGDPSARVTQTVVEVVRRNYPEGQPSSFRLVCPSGG